MGKPKADGSLASITAPSNTHRHLVGLLDDVLLGLPPQALDNVLALIPGALEPVGQLGSGVLWAGLQVLAAKCVAGEKNHSLEQAWKLNSCIVGLFVNILRP